MRYKALVAIFFSVLLVSCGSEDGNNENTTSKSVEMTRGQQVFNNNCLQCHSLVADKIGPNLRGALTKWDNDTSRIALFIRNAQEVINSGDQRAVQVAKEWNYAMMTPMPHLRDEDINAILEYIAE
ncbi:MAG: cytochrome c [Chitinophagaceae bacterium]|nr:cytochrome c [Chitinophagaceae bacterium]